MQPGIMPRRDDAERRRIALRRFIKARKDRDETWSVADWCTRAGVASSAVYNFLNESSQSLSTKTLEKLAHAEGTTVSELIGESPVLAGKGVLTIYARGAVEAGIWKEAVEWPEDEWVLITVPRIERQTESSFALLVRGPSMNLEYPEGTYVICVPILEFNGELKQGAHVVFCRRDRDGRVEATIKELRFDAQGRAWLWPKSTEPEYATPIEIPWPPDKMASENADGTEQVEISAVVIGMYRKVPS